MGYDATNVYTTSTLPVGHTSYTMPGSTYTMPGTSTYAMPGTTIQPSSTTASIASTSCSNLAGPIPTTNVFGGGIPTTTQTYTNTTMGSGLP